MIRNILQCIWKHFVAYPRPWLACCIGVLVFPYLSGLIPIVRFTEEEIIVAVHPRSIAVDAVYYYYNPFPFPVVQSYVLPFPENEDHSPPLRIELRQCLPEEKPVPVNHFLGKYRFSVCFPAQADVRIRLSYEQCTPQRRGTYILTSTKPWGRPLEKAIYRLIPDGVRITGSNYPLASDDSGAYQWTREQFMPPADWHISWKEEIA
jgi:hypothetical protein